MHIMYIHAYTYIYIYISLVTILSESINMLCFWKGRITCGHKSTRLVEYAVFCWSKCHQPYSLCFFHYPGLLKRLPLSNSENEPQHHPVPPIWGRPMIWTPILRNTKIQWFTYHGWHHFPICPYISHIQNWHLVFDSWFLLNPGGIKHLKSRNWQKI